MAVYSYQALDRGGKTVSGSLNAADRRAALIQVRELGLHPLDVAEAVGGKAAVASRSTGPPGRGRRIKPGDLAVLTRQLANLIGGGLPMMRTFDALLENTESARLYAILAQIREEVTRGESLRAALAQHPRLFSPLYLSLVEAGEQSGELGPVLNRLADFLEQDVERRGQIRAALMYPALLICVGTLIVFVLVTFLIPRFKVLFDEFERALPLPTQVVLGVASFCQQWWWALALGGAALWWLHRRWLATERGRLRWDTWRLRWPLLGRLHHRAATARLARTLATLLHGGVSILEALENVEGVVDNAALARAVRTIRDGVREGESLGVETRQTGMFPGLLAQMMLVGEETGDMESALNTVADAFEVEVSNSLKGLIALVEPLIILVMGAAVALVVFAMLLPIFEMNNIIQ